MAALVKPYSIEQLLGTAGAVLCKASGICAQGALSPADVFQLCKFQSQSDVHSVSSGLGALGFYQGNPRSALHLIAAGSAANYPNPMNDQKNFFKTDKAGLALATAFLMTLTGCVGYVDGPRAQVYADPYAFADQDDYVYYPNYECYYSISRHQYAYREGDRWVARSAPGRVTVDVLQASPAVRMNFHDSPAQHHEAVVRQYPKNWKPSGSNHGQNRKDDHREGHGDDLEK